MCIPTAIEGGLSVIQSVLPNISDMKTKHSAAQYNIKTSLINAKRAADEAQRQKQLGIENSRIKQIEGLREKNKQISKSGASGFDINSGTVAQNATDIEDIADFEAKETKKQYDLNARNYYMRANDYINQAKYQRQTYNNTILPDITSSLQEGYAVANNWYEKTKNNKYNFLKW